MIGQRPALSGRLHVFGHGILVVLGWAIFCGFWWVTLLRQPHFPDELGLLMAGALLLGPLVTLYWVLHNRGIYARKGPRRQVQTMTESYTHDWAGRPVRAQFQTLRQCSVIVVRSTQQDKLFQSASDLLRSNAGATARAPFDQLRQTGQFLGPDTPQPAPVPPVHAAPAKTVDRHHDPAPSA
jgi:hypothetical protein